MPGRSFNANQYRYGFNGQEKDDEIAGAGNINTAEFWQYDTRLGRRWETDPVVYSWQSPYACFNNNPIYFNDPSGLEPGGPGGPEKKNDNTSTDFPLNKGGNGIDLDEISIYPNEPGLGDIATAEQGVAQVEYNITIIDKNGAYADGKPYYDPVNNLTSIAGSRNVPGTDPNSFVKRYVDYTLQIKGDYTNYFKIQIRDELMCNIAANEKSTEFRKQVDNVSKVGATNEIINDPQLANMIADVKSNLKPNQKITSADITIMVAKRNDNAHNNRQFKEEVKAHLNKEIGAGFTVNFIRINGVGVTGEGGVSGNVLYKESSNSSFNLIFNISTMDCK